jgi:hypothetical protein
MQYVVCGELVVAEVDEGRYFMSPYNVVSRRSLPTAEALAGCRPMCT